MKSIKFYQLLSLVLLLLNVGLIVFFFATKPPLPHPPPHPGEVITVLQLDQSQEQQFLQLVHEHRTAMRDLDEQHKTALERYFSMIEEGNDSLVENALQQTLFVEQQKIEVTRLHFKAVKSILRPEQMMHYQEFIQHVLPRILGHPKKMPPPPHDF